MEKKRRKRKDYLPPSLLPKVEARRRRTRKNRKLRRQEETEAKTKSLLKTDHLSPRSAKIVKACARHGWILPNLAHANGEIKDVLEILDAWQFSMRKYFVPFYRLPPKYFEVGGRRWKHLRYLSVAVKAAKVSPRFYLSVLFQRYKRIRNQAPTLSICYQEKAFRRVIKARDEADKLEIDMRTTSDFDEKRKLHWRDFKSVHRFFHRNRDEFENFEEAVEYQFKRGKISQSFYELYFPSEVE